MKLTNMQNLFCIHVSQLGPWHLSCVCVCVCVLGGGGGVQVDHLPIQPFKLGASQGFKEWLASYSYYSHTKRAKWGE